MPCQKCGQTRSPDFVGTFLPSYPENDITEAGLVRLASAEECTEKYHGRWPSATVFILARGTENERLFRRGQKVEAGRLARTKQWTLDNVPADKLCHDQVEALFGG